MRLVLNTLVTAGAVMSALSLIAVPSVAQEKLVTVRAAMANSASTGALLIADARGYFKEAGINLVIEPINSTSDVLSVLAQGRLQVVGGGVSAGYFNALARGLPVIMTIARVSTPTGHNLMLRPDLKDTVKTMADLKGRTIATNGPGSISTYEIGKMLEPAGLSLKDVNIKIFPFPQYALAFANKAIDAGLVIPPWTEKYTKDGIALPFGNADKLVSPQPVTIAVNFVNTDWAKANRGVVMGYYEAYMRGIRLWCQGYHGGPERKEIIDLLIKTKVETRREILDGFWTARPIDGRIGTASLMDIQEFYRKTKMIAQTFPVERLVDHSYVDAASKKLGPFKLTSPESGLAGCR